MGEQEVTAAAQRHASSPLDVARVRADFPILSREVHGRPLVYLDSAASSQKPLSVLRAVDAYYRETHANVHRAVHELSVRATELYEEARLTVARHIGARDASEIVFIRGTTEAINLVAGTWGMENLSEGDEILLTKMEHHSNIVPWFLLAERLGVKLRWVDVSPDGRLVLEDYAALLSPRTRLVGVTHVSNSLGVVNPVREMAEMAHQTGALFLVDGAQAAPHLTVDVEALGCDFYAFSGHKMCGPTGIGVLWSRRSLLDSMPPYQGGGEMISEVHLDGFAPAAVPHKFEAGTPNIAGAVGLAEAIRYLQGLGMEAISDYETELTAYALDRLLELPALKLYGPTGGRVGVLSFQYADIHAHDLATILDQRGIAIRAGHHCNQPLMDHFGVDATARASLYLYSTAEEVDALVEGLHFAGRLFGVEG